jgi:hypothetical protein
MNVKMTGLLAVAAISIASLPGHAVAACGDRPGTPTDVRAEALSQSSIKFSWRDTTRPGEIPLGPFYDIEVTNGAGQGQPQSSTGEGYLFGGKVYKGLNFNTEYCFRIRARTEAGTEGCVSAQWSARVCATTFTPPLAPPPQQVSGPWSAVAFNGSGRWGFAVGQPSSGDASSKAVAGCGGAGFGCKVGLVAQAPCIAYVESRTNGYWFGFSVDQSQSRVESVATGGCSSGAPSGTCQLVKSICR